MHAVIDDDYNVTVGASSQRAATIGRDSAETVSDWQGSRDQRKGRSGGKEGEKG